MVLNFYANHKTKLANQIWFCICSLTCQPTACVSRWWAGRDSLREQKKPEARKMLENAAESHQSAARFVGRAFRQKTLPLSQVYFLPCLPIFSIASVSAAKPKIPLPTKPKKLNIVATSFFPPNTWSTVCQCSTIEVNL